MGGGEDRKDGQQACKHMMVLLLPKWPETLIVADEHVARYESCKVTLPLHPPPSSSSPPSLSSYSYTYREVI